ncbi:hypothetical protein LDENG_00239340, partial [Lucifuga dentata]
DVCVQNITLKVESLKKQQHEALSSGDGLANQNEAELQRRPLEKQEEINNTQQPDKSLTTRRQYAAGPARRRHNGAVNDHEDSDSEGTTLKSDPCGSFLSNMDNQRYAPLMNLLLTWRVM